MTSSNPRGLYLNTGAYKGGGYTKAPGPMGDFRLRYKPHHLLSILMTHYISENTTKYCVISLFTKRNNFYWQEAEVTIVFERQVRIESIPLEEQSRPGEVTEKKRCERY